VSKRKPRRIVGTTAEGKRVEADVEWRRAYDFAEIAEALGVATTQIMAARNPQADDVLVLYTRDETTLIWQAMLRRGVDGVLFVSSQPEAKPGMWEQIVEQMERDE
jgi:hypothetical protein